MNRKLRILTLFLLAILCTASWRCKAGKAETTNQLKVVVQPSRANVRVGERFGVTLKVENPTPTNQCVYAWDCSWSDNWESDNTNIVLGKQPCEQNVIGPVVIKPGGEYVNEGQMVVLHPVAGGRLSFRMGFTSFIRTNSVALFAKGRTWWSKSISVKVRR